MTSVVNYKAKANSNQVQIRVAVNSSLGVQFELMI